MIDLSLPWPPTMNHYWQVAPPKRSDALLFGRGVLKRLPRVTYISKAGQDFQLEVKVICSRLRLNRPLEGRVRIAMLFQPPDRRIRDFDNLLKPLFDSLEHGRVLKNDNQVRSCRWEEGPVLPGGRVLLKILELEQVPEQADLDLMIEEEPPF